MSKVSLGGSSTGTATFDIVAPATNTNRTITLPDSSGQVSVLDLRTAVTASGTAIDFTNIPATARRITVMFSGVSTNGTSPVLIRLGTSLGVVSTGYVSASFNSQATAVGGSANTSTAGFFAFASDAAAYIFSGCVHIGNITGNDWLESGLLVNTTAIRAAHSSGSVTLSGALDRLRITTVNGTDQFDAGTINILVE